MGVPLGFTVPTPTADGVYPYIIPVQPGLPPAQQTNLIGLVGTANWGPLNTPVFFNTLAQAIYFFGDDATLANNFSTPTNSSLTGAVQVAAPEGTNFCAIRVASAASPVAAAATGTLVDASAGVVANLMAIYNGSDGNSITATVNIVSGAFTAGTVMTSLTVTINNRQAWTSQPFLAGTAGYVKATFLAGLAAQISGSAGAPPCPYISYASAGSSVLHPTVTANDFSGGQSGASALVQADAIGAPTIGANTGLYALEGTGVNLINIVGMNDMSQASTMAAFAEDNSCLILCSFPSGTSTATAITSRATNNAESPWLIDCNDYTTYNDVVDATGPQYFDPATKIAAVISSLQPYQYPGNKPYIGCQNFLGTIRSGIPYSNAELGQLEQNGILIITNPIPRGSIWGLAHGMSSDGVTPISDTRMLNLIANELTEILGNFVGESQTPPPLPGQPDNDLTRQQARNAVAAYLNLLANPNAPQIAAWSQVMDGTNNTAATVAAGYLYDKILVTTLAGIRFILLGLSIGETVSVVAA